MPKINGLYGNINSFAITIPKFFLSVMLNQNLTITYFSGVNKKENQ